MQHTYSTSEYSVKPRLRGLEQSCSCGFCRCTVLLLLWSLAELAFLFRRPLARPRSAAANSPSTSRSHSPAPDLQLEQHTLLVHKPQLLLRHLSCHQPGSHRYCSPCHETHFEPPFLEYSIGGGGGTGPGRKPGASSYTRKRLSLSLSIGGGGSMLTMRVPWGSMNAVEKMKLGIG
jgi:hypothetical protein